MEVESPVERLFGLQHLFAAEFYAFCSHRHSGKYDALRMVENSDVSIRCNCLFDLGGWCWALGAGQHTSIMLADVGSLWIFLDSTLKELFPPFKCSYAVNEILRTDALLKSICVRTVVEIERLDCSQQ